MNAYMLSWLYNIYKKIESISVIGFLNILSRSPCFVIYIYLKKSARSKIHTCKICKHFHLFIYNYCYRLFLYAKDGILSLPRSL